MNERQRVALYVCTHQRNGPLATLLETVRAAADAVSDHADVSVVVVDDNPDGRASSVCEAFEGVFAGGIHYRHSGAQNISIARNLGIETAMELGDWVAMTDDDILVPKTWFVELLAVQRQLDADCVTGPAYLSFDESSPGWLRSQPFDRIGLFDHPELAVIEEGSTGNSMVRSSFLRDHPEVRFSRELGTLGGEDMVFFRTAVAAGLVSVYSRRVAVKEPFPKERSTAGYIYYRSFWMGNTEYQTSRRSEGSSRLRFVARAFKRLGRAVALPVANKRSGKDAQLHFAASLVAQAAGLCVGVLGIRVPHR